MPNWCDNYIQITGNDAEKIHNIIESLKDDDGIMQALYSTDTDEFRNLQSQPTFHIFSDYYGTKWDFAKEDCGDIQFGNDELTISVDTAWSPPIEFLRKLTTKYDVEARIEYFEGGMDFGGYESIADGETIDDMQTTYDEAVYILDNDLFWINLEDYLFERTDFDMDQVTEYYPFLTEEDLEQVQIIINKQQETSQ
jgi:hypothetical protein